MLGALILTIFYLSFLSLSFNNNKYIDTQQEPGADCVQLLRQGLD